MLCSTIRRIYTSVKRHRAPLKAMLSIDADETSSAPKLTILGVTVRTFGHGVTVRRGVTVRTDILTCAVPRSFRHCLPLQPCDRRTRPRRRPSSRREKGRTSREHLVCYRCMSYEGLLYHAIRRIGPNFDHVSRERSFSLFLARFGRLGSRRRVDLRCECRR